MSPEPSAAPRAEGVAFRSDRFRPELQVLRAAAVVLVVAYHFWPARIPGGFVGVDVFFVVSGFLITSHLLTEFDRDGRVSLPRFWARRARRLLPSSLLVLAATAVGVLVLAPTVMWQQAFREIVGSALYVQNWVLAADSVDYLAAENSPSPVQHFWSLSVEEQFYLTVPVLLVLAALAAGRSATVERRRVFLAGALGVVFLASFAYSIVLTIQAPGPAYFVTPTRAWEFAAGGLLAFATAWFARRSAAFRGAGAWAGWILIVVSAFVITGDSPFPGWIAALPVAAAALIIAAGRPPVPWAPDRLLTVRPVVFIGDISYAIYLWHWPALIFGQILVGQNLPGWVKVLLIGCTVALSWATTRFVENPVRRGAILTARKPRYTFAATLLAMALVAIPSGVGWSLSRYAATAELEQAAEIVAEGGECIGAGSRDPELDCDDLPHTELVPDPGAAVDDKSAAYDLGCISGIGIDSHPICRAGIQDGKVRVLVIGDSHAAHWLPAYEAIAKKRDWSITTYFKSACSYSTALNVAAPQGRVDTCRDWNREVADLLAAEAAYDLVFVSSSTSGNVYASDADAVRGYREAWATLTDRGSDVVVIRNTPRAPENTNACLEQNATAPDACDFPEDGALDAVDPMVQAATGQPGVHVLDLTRYFCWDGTCKPAIGGVVTFRDTHHITATLATTFGPVLGRRLDELGL